MSTTTLSVGAAIVLQRSPLEFVLPPKKFFVSYPVYVSSGQPATLVAEKEQPGATSLPWLRAKIQ
jgi:hypothetical protein